MQTDNCIIPRHILLQEVANGYSKQIALFLSLKKVYESGHIWQGNRIDLSKIHYHISRNTYNKYIEILIGMGWITRDKKGLHLKGITSLCKMYPLSANDRLKMIYLPNDNQLRNNIEKAAIQININNQSHKIKSNKIDITKTECNVQKKVRGEKKIYSTILSNDTHISQQEMAHKLGFRNRLTAQKRQRKWVEEKFIDCNQRVIIATIFEYKERVPGVFKKGKYFYRQLSNEISIRNNVGRKKEKPCPYYENENW